MVGYYYWFGSGFIYARINLNLYINLTWQKNKGCDDW